jgi:hypothetical protein
MLAYTLSISLKAYDETIVKTEIFFIENKNITFARLHNTTILSNLVIPWWLYFGMCYFAFIITCYMYV